MVDDGIYRNTEQPGIKLALILKLIERIEYSNEDLLVYILCIIFIIDHAKN
mgnify:CR=1 FL=1